MRKKVFLSLLLLGMCLSIQGFARINIVLKGSWNRVEKSINPNIPVQIYVEDGNKDITVQFFENLGSVNITIVTSDGNVVYNTILIATEMSTYSITLDDAFMDTEYCIIVANTQNAVSGLFSINRK